MQGKGIDQCALATARRSGYTNDVSPAGVGVKSGQDSLGLRAIVFDEADGPCYRAPASGQNSFYKLIGHAAFSWMNLMISSVGVPGPKTP